MAAKKRKMLKNLSNAFENFAPFCGYLPFLYECKIELRLMNVFVGGNVHIAEIGFDFL